jgi:hypothetical protein
MQFLAVRSDRQPPQFADDRYVRVQSVRCRTCSDVTYQLWAPHLETEQEAVHAQSEWLDSYLQRVCPEHPDTFLTPDRPEK